jgi:hypothetical protein
MEMRDGRYTRERSFAVSIKNNIQSFLGGEIHLHLGRCPPVFNVLANTMATKEIGTPR